MIDELTAVMKMMSEQVPGFENVVKDFTAEDLCELKEVFLSFEREIDNIEIPLGAATMEGTFLIELLEKVGVS